MQEKEITIEIISKQDLAKINSENISCLYFGDDCVHFRAFALENDNIICYEVSDGVEEDSVRDKLSKIFTAYSFVEHYLGMGHFVRVKDEYYKDFNKRIKNAKFFGYKESFEILFDLMKNKNRDTN